MKEEQKKKLKKLFEIVWHVASGLMNIISFIVAIVSAAKGNFDLSWKVVVTIVIVDSGLLVIFAIYASALWFKSNKIEKENKEELDKKLEEIKKERKEIIEYKNATKKNISFLEESINLSQSLSQQCAIQINKALTDIKECVDKLKNVIKGKDGFTKKDSQIIDLLTTLKTKVKERYNTFFRDCTEKLKTILDLSFENRNLNSVNSITIKQLNSALYWKDKASKEKAVSEAKIITTFRDSHTYTQYNREVGKKEYSISGNTSFNHCLNKLHYLHNNISDEDDNRYQNENVIFKSFYNCTIVVPIFVQEVFGKKYYGYLTADTLNTDSNIKEVYDSQMLKIMKNTASIIAMYFNSMEQHWWDTLNAIKEEIICLHKPKNVSSGATKSVDLEIEFLSMVYNQKYKSYNFNEAEVA